jgi:hypothetical protein
MTKSDPDLWRQAKATMDQINSGELKAKPAQVKRLQTLLEGQEAWAYADAELKRAMIGLLYERHVYISKLWFLERVGAQNRWGHPLLRDMNPILYEETDEFKLEDYMGAKSERMVFK